MSISSGAAKPAFTILAVVLSFVVHGAQAAASCGDYLHTVHSRPAQHEHAVTAEGKQPASSDSAATHRTPRPASPCSGPGCERNDGPVRFPLFPTISGPSVVSDALLNSAPRLAAPTGQIPLSAESAAPRPGFPRLLEKPPRAESV